MSALSLSDFAYSAPGNTPHVAGAQTSKGLRDALSALARYIPAEGLALYLVITAFAPTYALLGLIAGSLLNGVVSGLRWIDARKGSSAPSVGKLVYVQFVLGGLLSVYVSALAGNPLTGGAEGGTVLGGVLVLISSAFLAVLADKIGLAPRR